MLSAVCRFIWRRSVVVLGLRSADQTARKILERSKKAVKVLEPLTLGLDDGRFEIGFHKRESLTRQI